jgi:SIR2-like domain
MRFFADGPIIPRHLLEARDAGNVVFLCGAGVSRPAGLPDFMQLARDILEGRNSSLAQSALDSGEAPERIFNKLITEFGRPEIDQLITERLKTPSDFDPQFHKMLLRLSRNAEGKAQLVTTNYDLLFEKAEARLTRYIPPALPDIAAGRSFHGLVYLHGRLSLTKTYEQRGYVISSADFGRAYLAEGWATRFIRGLLENYVIVLVGYRAEDPPVEYLLRGLHDLGGGSHRHRIYAFSDGTPEVVRETWSERGVEGLAYAAANGHDALWKTLGAWADMADKPERWRASIVGLARTRPDDLQPHERGQVAALISDKSGAKAFADVEPPLPGEWLCVFDAAFRYAEPRRPYGDEVPFDPLQTYGLDDDPPRPVPINNQAPDLPVSDLLVSLENEGANSAKTRLGWVQPDWGRSLPPRLFNLARWIANSMDDPVVGWWAAGRGALNRGLLTQIEQRLERGEKPISAEVRRFWHLLLEANQDIPNGYPDSEWYGVQQRLQRDGWSASGLRNLERAVRPYLTLARPGYTGKPPAGNWGQLQRGEIGEFGVKFRGHGDFKVEVPDDQLASVVAILRQALVRASDLLADTETWLFDYPELIPIVAENEDAQPGHAGTFIGWFKQLFDQLAAFRPELAAREARLWDTSEKWIFSRLTVYAALNSNVFEAGEAASIIGAIPDEQFWDSDLRRVLLHCLRVRWEEFNEDDRAAIEARIVKGQPRSSEEKVRSHRRRATTMSAMMLGWLELKSCILSKVTMQKLLKLRKVNPNWKPEWDEEADDSTGIRVRSVATDADPQSLADEPVSSVIDRAIELSRDDFRSSIHFRPFAGLVSERPLSALSALATKARRGEYPKEFWGSLFDHWPEQTNIRIRWLLAYRIVQIPTEAFAPLRGSAGSWLARQLRSLLADNKPRAMEIIDRLLAKFEALADAAQVDGDADPKRDRMAIVGSAINGPIGKLTETVISAISKLEIGSAQGIPVEYRQLFERMLKLPGGYAGHAAYCLAHQFPWLQRIDPDWSEKLLLPLFQADHPLALAAWYGIAGWNRQFPEIVLSALMNDLLKLLSGEAGLQSDKDPKKPLFQQMLFACDIAEKVERAGRFKEASKVLVNTDDEGREDALWGLYLQISAKPAKWRSFVKPFLTAAWPRHSRYKTDNLSRSFARLILATDNHFPDAVATIRPFVVPVAHLDMIVHYLRQAENGTQSLIARFPDSAVVLLDALINKDHTTIPFELAEALTELGQVKPSLRQDSKFRRLRRMLE